jgi:hypothetical protein
MHTLARMFARFRFHVSLVALLVLLTPVALKKEEERILSVALGSELPSV